MRWLFIGAGNMASSLIGGLVASGKPANSIAVVDPSKQARDSVVQRFDCHASDCMESGLVKLSVATATADELSAQPLGLVLAVKPHIVQDACKAVSVEFDNKQLSTHSTLVLSVAAGVRTESMQDWLPDNIPLVRCMPNTPALMGLGATALFANQHCSDANRIQASELLGAAGSTLWVNQEQDLDAVTAVSGSGPAYFFYLIEHMIEAGVQLGLPRQAAEQLAIDTAYGAASMARAREFPPEVLRENVTSKGGTTAAALAVFDQNNTSGIINSAMQAAQQRAIELGAAPAPDQNK